MILFMIAKEPGGSPISTEHPIVIPLLYPSAPPITETNVQLVSWNEISYDSKPVTNVELLKWAVFDAAQKDDLCRNINAQFLSQYRIDIFEVYSNPLHINKKIINDVFASWPHPMIGNILLSPRIRPQTAATQYVKNWRSFPEKYMHKITKDRINQMINEPRSVGLDILQKSSRDQVRVCKDMTELARAIMGEISTYATKKLEKIYALELCASPMLYEAQKALILPAITACNLHDMFIDFSYNPFSRTEYLYFYFPTVVSKLKNDYEKQWTVFVNFINWAIEMLSPLKPTAVVDSNFLRELEIGFKKIPPTMRCAMIINAIRKFQQPGNVWRYSMAVANQTDLEKPDFVVDCTVVKASQPYFIPTLQDNLLLWNRMREEKHIATKTYRHFLMPLWGGPSGHSSGLVLFYSELLWTATNKTTLVLKDITGPDINVSVASVILPTMFAFWRLYYDKRISAVHTLAETYEAVYSFKLEDSSILSNTDDISELTTIIKYGHDKIKEDVVPGYNDAFETVFITPRPFGLINSVYIMAQIKEKHYKGDIDALDVVTNALRSELTDKGYAVPQWSKPLVLGKSLSAEEYDEVFNGTVIRSYTNLNVRTFALPKADKFKILRASPPSERLSVLYNKIVKITEYNFSEDFENLPECITETGLKPFLSAISFYNVSSCKLENAALTFTGTAKTDADFWNSITSICSVRDEEEFLCTITDDDDGYNFTGEITVNSIYKITDKLSLTMKSLIIKSGLDETSSFPCASVMSYIQNGNDRIDVTVTLSLSGGVMYINGEYESGKVLTISKLLTLFGIDGVVPVSSILPDDESIFGSLGLRDVSMTVSTAPLSINNIGFTITTGKPWNIYDNKITLQPYFEIYIDMPFDSERRKIDYSVLGKWTLADTIFDLLYRSDKVIILQLAQNSVLNFAEVAKQFDVNVKFPDIKLTGMNMTLDLASKNYSLDLSASDVLKFDVGGTKIGIDDISFSLDFMGGKFSDLAVSGTLVLGGLSLNVSGEYNAGGGFAFQAMAYSELDYSLRDFAVQIAADISASFDPASIPENFLTVSIRTFCVSYESADSAFNADVDLENVLVISDKFSINQFALTISSSKSEGTEFQIIARAYICGTAVSLLIAKKGGDFIISGSADFEKLTFKNIADDLGIPTEYLPGFITEFAVTNLSMQYNITKKDFQITVVTSAGTVTAEIISGVASAWSISYKTNPSTSVDMLNMPLVGEMIKNVSPGTSDFSVKDFEIAASSVNGVVFKCIVLGKNCELEIYKPAKTEQHYVISNSDLNFISNTPSTVKWIQFDKTFAAIVTIQKVGIGLDGSKAVLLLDASLNVSPLSFSLMEAGVGINIANPSDVAFYLSGFGVSFDNGSLSIGGSFSRIKREGKEVYTGSLLIKFKTITAAAIGEYSSGSLMAYFALSASIGGPPAFFITGIAIGFGYNKKLCLPQVEKVPEFPLIKAAISGFNQQTLDNLNKCIKDENKQNFIAAGVKFTSFKLVNGFALLTFAFGNEFEIGLLGLADISVPPNVTSNPIAKAQLALIAVLNISKGVFRVEARLTSESYILSRDCKLTGGFAAYFWFDKNKYSGDFVISLGGYHPAFVKPAHYPVVPRLGLNWNVTSHLNISGEIYFALTPSTLMAGGKLSAVYTQGNLKAWFIAYADFLISWKPFSYDISIGVSVGASYRIDWWFIHKTFSIELGADLHIWGPEVHGKVHISWFIISFTISFSAGDDYSKKPLDWNEFKESFLLDTTNTNGRNDSADILSAAIEGCIGKALDGTDIVDANSLCIAVSSKVPESGNVRPVNDGFLNAPITLDVISDKKINVNNIFTKSAIRQNVPSAMWKKSPAKASDKLKEESTVKDAVCGVSFTTNNIKPELFPKTRYISLDELYRNNTIEFKNCFGFIPEKRLVLSDNDSINRFSKNANSAEAVTRRKKFLKEYGITEDIKISHLADNAENWFSEYMLISN